MARLSVIVPFFNVQAYIGEALESIALQTLQDIEVIMVNDGSTDGSAFIAKSLTARDPRFRLIEQPNRGLGPARNAGVREASAPYLAFADSDDLVDPHAYELLVSSLERTGSDIACGGVRRFKATGLESSWLHAEAFKETVQRTHVTRRPILLRDRTAWNKVFRRSFWDANSLEFPGTLYEDGPVTLRAHVLASSVDIFRDIVYYWRVRGSGELSITQRARDIANIEQRMASVTGVAEFLAAAAPELKPVYDQSVLNVDMGMLVSAYGLASETDRARLAELALRYLRTVDYSVYREVSAGRRLHCYLLGKRMLPELLEALRYWRRGEPAEATAIKGGPDQSRWYICYPFFRDPVRAIPDDIYDITDEMTLNARLDAVTWRAGRLRIEGRAYIRRLNFGNPGDCRLRVKLRNRKTRRTVRLRVRPVYRPDVTVSSGQSAVSYDWSGFAVEVSPRRLATAPGLWRMTNWELRIEVAGQGLRREGPVGSVASGSARWPEGRWVNDSVRLQPAAEDDGRFFVRAPRVGALVTACRASGDALEIEGWIESKLSPGASLVASPRLGGAAAVRVPVQAAGSAGRGRTRFRARVPAARLVRQHDAATTTDRVLQARDEVTWDLSVAPGKDMALVRLTSEPEVMGARVRNGRREITAIATQFGYLSVLERTMRPIVRELTWGDDERLILAGDYTDPVSRPAEFLLRHGNSSEQHAVPLAWKGGAFTADLHPARMPGMAGELPLASGNWDLLARVDDLPEVTVAVARSLLPRLPGYHRAGDHEIEAQPYRTDALRLESRTALASDEHGHYAVRRLRRIYYPQAMARPLRNMAVFDTFSGRGCSCNPRAICAELRRTNPDLERVWVTRDGQFSIPGGDRAVLADSRAHFEALARARYVISNDLLPTWFRKRDGQFCLQTWHGTPLKRIGLDIDRPQFASGLIYPDLLRADAANWDVLLSQNQFSTLIFRRALAYDGEILESGYPRNDLLYQPDKAERAAEIRLRLGIPADKRVVLYAPTWRDDAVRESGGYRFQLQLDLGAAVKALGADHMLLLRLHTNLRAGQAPRTDGVIDVTRYPDITDLYLISDVMITDYSSVMFDFAGTGRPILFFTYDMERYRDQLRGFYFDFEADAPGPLLRTSDEVLEALRGIEQVEAPYREAYRAFADKYCALDDGAAAARAVERLLAGY